MQRSQLKRELLSQPVFLKTNYAVISVQLRVRL